MEDFSDLIIYADESGDHDLQKIDRQYPIFALSLCVFDKKYYARKVVPKLQEFKFKWFGHDSVILHEREIRKQEGNFSFLFERSVREEFISDISSIIKEARFKIAACVIDKRRLKGEYLFQDNPYSIALEICIEKIYVIYRSKYPREDKVVHFVFERRGDKEDRELELEFLRIVSGKRFSYRGLSLFRIIFVDKKANSCGLQIADLTARPIGLKVLRVNSTNRAFDTIERKLLRDKLGSLYHKGIAIFP